MNRIAKARELRGLSQQQLADKMGVAQQTVNYLEHKDDIKLSKLEQIAAILDVSISWLCGQDAPMETEYQNSLSPQEAIMVKRFRACSLQDKETLLRIADALGR